MDGVTIIKTIEVAEAPPTIIVVLFSILAILFILAGIILIFSGLFDEELPISALGIMLFVLGLVLAFWVGSLCESAPTEAETKYQIVVDDTVSIGELTEHYEILDVDGKIFTVREK